jgi:hypothetical protein
MMMPDHDNDIVERLRVLDASNCMDSDHLHEGLVVDAADEIERLRAELAAAIKQRDEAVELYTDLLRRLSGSAPPRAAFLSGDATQKEGGGA